MCLSVLEENATDETIVWQDEMSKCSKHNYALLQHLINQNFLSRHFDLQVAKTNLVDFQEDVQAVTILFSEVPELFTKMQSPSRDDGCMPAIYQDAFQYSVNVVTCNKLLAPQ